MTHIAYLDPGTGTLIVQALLGGTAGVAVLLKTKGKRLFKRSTDDASEEDPAVSEADDHPAPNPNAQ
ncbi:MAG: hypothetical protein ABFS21_02080 [Actinomycetota bacterium]